MKTTLQISTTFFWFVLLSFEKDNFLNKFNTHHRYSFDVWSHRRKYYDWNQWNNSTSYTINRGFTGHEHMDLFGLINMGGRVYDPVLGRFISPDPYVQMPNNSQNFNRYGYCLNNPLVYTDPDGEWIHLVIGAAIGGTMNLFMNADNIDNFGQGLVYFGIGAAAGALSAGVGMGVNASIAGESFISGLIGTSNVVATGFLSGMISGAAGGLTGGFVNGFGNSAMQADNNINDMFKAGINSAAVGALGGGAIGGLMGGLDALQSDRNFLSGSEDQHVLLKIQDGEGLIKSSEDMSRNPLVSQKMATQLHNNSSVSITRNGEISTIRIEIPNNIQPSNIYEITGIKGTMINLPNTQINNGAIVITCLGDNVGESVSIFAKRWLSQTNSFSISDLFHKRSLNKNFHKSLISLFRSSF